ncbi:MAG TPA: glycosyltransferase family 39 protein [Acidimicrobiales bacterium]|nr:glycosyltransferase family 39 protein [Acidimicrobiales bacterium]
MLTAPPTTARPGHLRLAQYPDHDRFLASSQAQARKPAVWQGRAGLFALLTAAALLYLWDLKRLGWANGYYAAAVQAGSKNWEAAFFGSLDAANGITVDKAPLALWPMEAAVRVFGMSTWALLVPQALEGVATVAVLFAIVRRGAGPAAGFVTGAIMAITPISVVIFRYDNPDALLVLLLCLSWLCAQRGIEHGLLRWAALAGACVGLGFLAKELEALLVLPSLTAGYLLCSSQVFWKKVRALVTLGASAAAIGGWWLLVVQLTPSRARPYIGGSAHNTLSDVILGYNGVDRITGAVRDGRRQPFPIGLSQLTRLFEGPFATASSWLLPAAFIFLATCLVIARRHDGGRSPSTALLVVGGTWLVTMWCVFSYGAGAINGYYTVALAPPIAAVIATGGTLLWSRRSERGATLVLAGSVAITGVWAVNVIGKTHYHLPLLQIAILLACLGSATALLAGKLPSLWRHLTLFIAAAGMLAGPCVFSLAAVVQPPAGSDPLVPGFGSPPTRSVAGALETISTPTREVVAMLQREARSFKWVGAVVGGDPAAGYELATGLPVLAVGGFAGTDAYPSLVQFEGMVRSGEIHYFVTPGLPQPCGHPDDACLVAAWATAHFKGLRAGGVQLYDLAGTIPAAPLKITKNR